MEENHTSLKPEWIEVTSHVCGLEKLVKYIRLVCQKHLLFLFMMQWLEQETTTDSVMDVFLCKGQLCYIYECMCSKKFSTELFL